MSQNTSSAVMQQRAEPRDSLDLFPTPPWATRALCEQIDFLTPRRLAEQTCLEPACGLGHMVRPLREYFGEVRASDVYPYGFGAVDDFLLPGPVEPADWIISNPPFKSAQQFIVRALGIARVGVAMLVRTSFLEGTGRHRDLFSIRPPTLILQFAERVPMLKGRVDPKATTATSYAWLAWSHADAGTPTRFDWIAPCRKRLEQPEDYAEVPAA